MSVSGIPVQSGGAAVIAAAAVKAGGTFAVEVAKTLPATGAAQLRELAVAGATLIATGGALVRRGRKLRLTAGEELD